MSGQPSAVELNSNVPFKLVKVMLFAAEEAEHLRSARLLFTRLCSHFLWPLEHLKLYFYLFILCWGVVSAVAHLWSGDTLWISVLATTVWGPKDSLYVCSLGGRPLDPMSHLLDPPPLFGCFYDMCLAFSY